MLLLGEELAEEEASEGAGAVRHQPRKANRPPLLVEEQPRNLRQRVAPR